MILLLGGGQHAELKPHALSAGGISDGEADRFRPMREAFVLSKKRRLKQPFGFVEEVRGDSMIENRPLLRGRLAVRTCPGTPYNSRPPAVSDFSA